MATPKSIEYYSEIGNWARHNSTVRMTVTPFLITVSLSVMAFKWNDKRPIFIIISAAIWGLAMLLLWYFTKLTVRAEVYLKTLETSLRNNTQFKKLFFEEGAVSSGDICTGMGKDISFRAGLFLTILYGFGVVWWICSNC